MFVNSWSNGQYVSDYNYNGNGKPVQTPASSLLVLTLAGHSAGEDFDKDLTLENIDFGTYVSSSFVI